MPKLRADQLTATVAKSLAPVYLVSGDEPLLIQESCDQIRKAARTQGFTEREIFHAETNFDWNQLLASANSLSLFSDKKIFEIRMPSGKPGDKGTKAILEYLENPSSDNLLLVITEKLDSATQKSKWIKAIEDNGIHVQIWPIPPTQLSRWILTRLQQAGLSADNSAVDLLASRIEGNLLAAVQEIEKLALLTTDKHISYELMASAVADSARYDVFSLADKALHGDARSAAKTLQGLKGEGTDAITLLWAILRDIRSLNQIAQAIAQGKAFEAAARQAGVWEKRQPLMQNVLRRLKPAQLQQMLRKANAIDKSIKGMRNAEPWDELLDLVLNLAGVQSLNNQNERLNLKL
jgi:DNA polymerase III subunit delta